MRMRHWVGAAVLATAVSGATTSAAGAAFSPVDAPGPALTVPAQALADSVKCTGDLKGSAREPVLLLPATGVNSQQNYAYNYEKAFAANGTPYCTSDQPGDLNSNLGDVQTRGEYVTYAIRRTHELAGRKIAVLGHSQGGMVMRWSLRFWPDTRAMVQDVIGMAGSNHGTVTAVAACAPGCAVASYQQRSDSNFTAALNSFQETFAGIDYTEAYTHLDQVVTPNLDSASGSSSLRTGPGRIANVAIQDICPADPSEHLQIGTTDAVAYALVEDALTHDGPADPSRIPATVCLQPYQPGVDGSTVLTDSAASFAALGQAFASAPSVQTEPALRCYVTVTCSAGSGSGSGTGSGSGAGPGSSPPTKTCASRRRFTVQVDWPSRLRYVRATLEGRKLKLRRSASGRRTVFIDLRGVKASRVTLRIVGRNARGGVTTRIHRYRTCVKH